MTDYLSSSLEIGDCLVMPNAHQNFTGIDRFLRKGLTILVTPSRVIVGPLDCDPLPDPAPLIYHRIVRTIGEVPQWIIDADSEDDDHWVRPRVFKVQEVITLCRRARLLAVMRSKSCTLKVIPNGRRCPSRRTRCS